jgi:hypothetical protein
MIGLKRFSRHGLVISAIGHVGVLAVGLLFVRASSHEAVPPEAMLVEVVTPQDIPRLSGTPSNLPTSGTERAAPSRPGNANNEQRPAAPPQQKEERNAQRSAPPKAQEKETAPKQTKAPPLSEAEAAEVTMTQSPPPSPDPPAPDAADTPAAPDVAATMAQLAQLALVGGRLGGGFAAPPIASPVVGYDYTAAFRERISWCSPLAGIAPTEKISVPVRVFLNRDGTLSAAPRLLEPNPSAKQLALLQSFVAGLEKCQPYTMLPPDRYKEWKIMDLLVFPMDSFGG